VGRFDELEDQMCLFSQDYDRANGSPDRVDALVWGLSSLFERMTGRRRKTQDEEDQYKLVDVTGQQNANIYRGESDTGWMVG
jgi:hypothetical protein